MIATFTAVILDSFDWSRMPNTRAAGKFDFGSMAEEQAIG
jgi:deoxyribodipyrimidine photolyase-like uncharacterized protein